MKKNSRLVLLYQVIAILLLSKNVLSSSFLGIVPFTNDSNDSSWVQLSSQLLERLQFEMLPGGIKSRIVDGTCDSCVSFVHGTIQNSDGAAVLRFEITDKTGSDSDQKVIPLSGYSNEDIIDLCILKIRHYLELHYIVKVRVSSKPLDCELFLNGIKVGKTPSEINLEKGSYFLTLEHDYCKPFVDTVNVVPGSTVDIDATLKFSGYTTKPFWYGTLFFSLATAIVWGFESRYHRDYKNLDTHLPEQVYTDYFNRYQTANHLRIVALNASVLSATVSGYLTFKNAGIKKKLFTEPKNH